MIQIELIMNMVLFIGYPYNNPFASNKAVEKTPLPTSRIRARLTFPTASTSKLTPPAGFFGHPVATGQQLTTSD
jgi:hypothetical protein